MFCAALLTMALAVPGGHAPVARPAAQQGRLSWFQGTFDELMAEARRTRRTVFLDFWAEWCSWCKRLDRDTFNDASVADEMRSLLCYAVDKESEQGARLAERYGIVSLPTLVFLAPDGGVVDAIVGYLGPDDFEGELRRIKRGERTLPALREAVEADPDDLFRRFDLAVQLTKVRAPDAARELARVQEQIRAGRGFDDASIEDNWRLAQGFQKLADRASLARHVQRIRELDPEGRSLPMRRMRLEEIVRQIDQGYSGSGSIDLDALRAFLDEERDEALLFEGWMHARFLLHHQAEEARKRGRSDERDRLLAEARRAEAAAWRVCPPDRVASLGHDLAWGWYSVSADLGAEELAFAVAVAERAAAAAPGSAKHLDTLACCLDAAGRVDEAIAAIRRAIELAPEDPRYVRRLRELEGGSDG